MFSVMKLLDLWFIKMNLKIWKVKKELNQSWKKLIQVLSQKN